MKKVEKLTRGSEWHRWDPHIHTPGTMLNNQFGGSDSDIWDQYLTRIEEATPTIKALGITDYYVTENYKKVRQYHKEGRLQNVNLIFPNVEMRLDIAPKGSFINLHLLVSPEDEDHIEKLQGFLSDLHCEGQTENFKCIRKDLISLGMETNSKIVDDMKALECGVDQFKVDFKELRQIYRESTWAKSNILIAVPAGSNDGTSGMKASSARSLRRRIERFAHVIFSSNYEDREFWLGRKTMPPDEIRENYGGLKPCIHGSDAHKLKDVASPSEDRFCWIKGEPEFDTLQQVRFNPEDRAFIGKEAQTPTTPSQIISEIGILNAPWVKTPKIPLNSGLVAIIGARGSGKTALADMIAAGCDSIPTEAWTANKSANPSFLARASSLIGEAKVKVVWSNGDQEERALNGSDANEQENNASVCYLSQQFVEKLCSSHGLADDLLQKIEEVIFESYLGDKRYGTLGFSELLDKHASRHRIERERQDMAVAQISERISREFEKKNLVANYESLFDSQKKRVKDYISARSKLVSTNSKIIANRHSELTEAVDQISTKLQNLMVRHETLLSIQDEVKNMRHYQAPVDLRAMKERHRLSYMTDDQWKDFLLDYIGPVDVNLKLHVRNVKDEISELRGKAPPANDPKTAYFSDDTDLNTLSLKVLKAEMERLEQLVIADKEVQNRYAELSKMITRETATKEALAEKLEDAQGAEERMHEQQKERYIAYSKAFDALAKEQSVLEELYAPLKDRLSDPSSNLNKLSFSVARVANVEKWASEAEETLIDLRKAGNFRGKGALLEVANKIFKNAWETGDSDAVVKAMEEFHKLHQGDILKQSPVDTTDQTAFRDWTKRLAQWLFSTDHIEIRYEISYDGVDIRKLSPGLRGIVLLLLYLGIDHNDTRPLVIDQPEENLDPKSVFEELVQLFVKAKLHRQVIMVTHNANLVINTNADQVIIAKAGLSSKNKLPHITYISGGLEKSKIRKMVCEILEGGENAFQERARRLRVSLDK